MHITSLDDIKKIKPNMEGAKGIYKQIPISRDNGTPTVSFRVFTIEPGGHTPLHTHPFEHVNYVIEGNGTVIDGDRERDLNEGDFVLVLPGETHQYRNTSEDKNMLLLYVQSLRNTSNQSLFPEQKNRRLELLYYIISFIRSCEYIVVLIPLSVFRHTLRDPIQ